MLSQQIPTIQIPHPFTRVFNLIFNNIQMKPRSFLAILILLSTAYLFHHHQNNILHSDIIHNESTLDFFLADMYKLSWA